MSEGFLGLLTPDASEVMAEVGSPALRNIGMAIGALSICRLALDLPAVGRRLRLCWPVLVPVGVALASIFWSADADLAMRRSLALVLTTLFALFLAIRFDHRQLINCVVAALLLYCVGSLVLIFGAPRIGTHTAAETRFYEHVGAWRGLSAFKNDFGRMAAFSALVFTVVALVRRPRSLVLLGAAGLAVVLVVGSRSGQAVSLLALTGGALLYMLILDRMDRRMRTAFLVMSMPIGLFLLMIGPTLVSMALSALGKDPTLTGRLEIWPAVITALDGHILFGGGYGSGWGTLVNARMNELLGRQIGHAHNGYLNLIVDIGIIGLAVTLGVLALLIVQVYRRLSREGAGELVLLAVLTIAFTLAGNWVGSFLLKFNTVFWVLVVFMYSELARSAHETLTGGGALRGSILLRLNAESR
ncbi:MAG TPA: O-antigen ligase family protein [Bosea sp. (in: a-proteobacteria)]